MGWRCRLRPNSFAPYLLFLAISFPFLLLFYPMRNHPNPLSPTSFPPGAETRKQEQLCVAEHELRRRARTRQRDQQHRHCSQDPRKTSKGGHNQHTHTHTHILDGHPTGNGTYAKCAGTQTRASTRPERGLLSRNVRSTTYPPAKPARLDLPRETDRKTGRRALQTIKHLADNLHYRSSIDVVSQSIGATSPTHSSFHSHS